MKEYTGYYTLPNSCEPFEGQIIKLDGQSFNILFQEYSDGNEYKFRERLYKFDDWLAGKPPKVYNNWIKHIVTWMQKDIDNN